MTVWLVDAHATYQAGLNVEQLAAEGIGALIVKATQGDGSSYVAPAVFDAWIARARSAGMVAGAYHWLDGSDSDAQLDRFLQRLDAVGGPEGLLCALDVEDNSVTWPVLQSWVERWRVRTDGHPLLLYTGAWWWGSRRWPGASLTPHLWLSRYVGGSDVASRLYQQVPDAWWQPNMGDWDTATMLQFSSAARVAGQAVDVSAFRGSLDELRALTYAKGGDVAFTPQQEQIVIEGTSLVARMAKGFDTLDDGQTPNALYQMIRELYGRSPVALSEDQVNTVGAAAGAEAAQVLGTRVEDLEGQIAELRALVVELVDAARASVSAASGVLGS